MNKIYKKLIAILFVGGLFCGVANSEEPKARIEATGDFDSFLDDLDDIGELPEGEIDGEGSQWEQFKLLWEEDPAEAMKTVGSEFLTHLKSNKGKYSSGAILTVIVVALLLKKKKP
jgi:hypothetical protein